MKKFYAPDDKHDWEDLGSACKKYWGDGIPDIVITEQGQYMYKQYAGHVWRTKITEEKETESNEQ